jgi:predicted acyltransferase
MILGLVTGEWLKGPKSKPEKLRGMAIAGVALILGGLVLQWAGICPIVKRVWTSAYTLYSGGIVILMLAGFYALIDWKGYRRWAFPLVVVGMNSIAIYFMSWTMEDFVRSSLQIHLGAVLPHLVSATFLPIAVGILVMLIFWSILLWMYRRKIFLRI